MISKKSPLMLMILDGFGLGKPNEYNAIHVAKTPFIDKLFSERPNSSLEASGEAVGLPKGLMGNSEVGHLNIGAGRVVNQDILRITKDIDNKGYENNPQIKEMVEKAKQSDGVLHLLGLFSDGGVHSADNHLEAFIKRAIDFGIKQVALHIILDGRDVPPKSGLEFFKKFKDRNNYKELVYSTVAGRFFAMDRDNRWDRVEKAFNAFVNGTSEFKQFDDPAKAIEDAYSKGENDEFVKPRIIKDTPRISDRDGIFCFNFRADRVREITMAFMNKDFDSFDVSGRPDLSHYLCLTEYKDDFGLPIAYPSEKIENILSETVAKAGLTQLKIAETEKYPHVTFFFNGGEEKEISHEDRTLIPSPREVATYDEKPEMSAHLITDKLLEQIKDEKYEYITINYANGDMVGHTGIMEAAIKAVETLDVCIKKVVDEVLSRDGEILIIADHGNCELMVDENNHPHTAHTTNPVPAIFVSNDKTVTKIKNGALADVAPTLLKRLNVDQPMEMTGKSLI